MHPFLLRSRFYLATLGLILGIMGIARDARRIVWIGIGCLGIATLLRITAKVRGGHDTKD